MQTKDKRNWSYGPPPHVGWWNASKFNRSLVSWRWWNGKYWSMPAFPHSSLIDVIQAADSCIYRHDEIEWNDYYPKNARVSRTNPGEVKNDH